jgi:alkylhydroperoxidase/carboxymuconolactone decarboxylase family protein YurZ
LAGTAGVFWFRRFGIKESEKMFSLYDEFFAKIYGEGGVFDRKTKHLIALAASLAAGCEP